MSSHPVLLSFFVEIKNISDSCPIEAVKHRVIERSIALIKTQRADYVARTFIVSALCY